MQTKDKQRTNKNSKNRTPFTPKRSHNALRHLQMLWALEYYSLFRDYL